MAKNPVVFACANPTPEIFPEEAKAGGAAVVGKDSTLYVAGDFQTTDALALSNANVILQGATVGLGAVTASDTALTIASKQFTAASLSGVQLGVINIAGSSTGSNTMYGLQLGVFNIFKGGSDQFHGIQFGLLNFVTRSDMNALPLLRIEF